MSTEINHHGMSVTVEDKLIQEMDFIGINVVEEIKAGIDAAIEDEVTHLINPPIAEIYSKPNCPFCVKAKHILEKRGIAYEELDAVALRDTLIERVTAETGRAPRTVPQIWLDGKHIGGHDQLVAYFKTQETKI